MELDIKVEHIDVLDIVGLNINTYIKVGHGWVGEQDKYQGRILICWKSREIYIKVGIAGLDIKIKIKVGHWWAADETRYLR